ncbi:MAG TPA: DUF1007 family protein [Pseudolabrys sp.]|nr:DUF1007 family protein [Pseudolabrys sp.]
MTVATAGNMFDTFLRRILPVGLCFLIACSISAHAHPHVWIKMQTEVVYAPDGRITGVRQAWAFDEMFSTFVTQGLENWQKGKFTREELAPLAKSNLEAFKEFAYFTYVTADGKEMPFSDPLPDYWIDYSVPFSQYFTLPFKTPVRANELKLEIYDPTIFINFEFAKETPVKLVGATRCRFDTESPREMTPRERMALSQIAAEVPNTTMAWGHSLRIKSSCIALELTKHSRKTPRG